MRGGWGRGRRLPEPVSQVLIDEKAVWEDHILNQEVKTGGQQEQSPKEEPGLTCLRHRELRDREEGSRDEHVETKGVSRGMWLCRSRDWLGILSRIMALGVLKESSIMN